MVPAAYKILVDTFEERKSKDDATIKVTATWRAHEIIEEVTLI